MGKLRSLIKVATVAGPVLMKVARKYGPEVKTALERNPHVLNQVKLKAQGAGLRTKNANLESDLGKRIEILRQQVTHLYAVSQTPELAQQARAWRNELASLERSVPLLEAMSPKLRKAEYEVLQQRIDRLSADILAVSISDHIEDAALEDEPNPGSTNTTGY